VLAALVLAGLGALVATGLTGVVPFGSAAWVSPPHAVSTRTVDPAMAAMAAIRAVVVFNARSPAVCAGVG